MPCSRHGLQIDPLAIQHRAMVRSLWLRALTRFLLLAFSVHASVALAGDGWNAPAQTDLQDCVLSLSVRQALQQDEGLGIYNLGVSVRSGVATLWGTVPSMELSQRAQDLVQGVAGVTRVRNELRIDAVEPLRADTPPWLPSPWQGPHFPDPAPAGLLASRPPTVPQGQPLQWEPKLPLVASTSPQRRLNDPALADSRPNPVVLLRPVEVQEPPRLIEQIDRLRRQDVRFRSIHLQVQGGIVSLSGTVNRAEDFYDFARLAAQVAGVERVILTSFHIP
jgi:osmotically-inducible protein OsmY